VVRSDPSAQELAALVEEAIYLFEAGVLRSEQRLRRLKNLALARIPAEPATERIVRFIGELRRDGHW
jgi:hypothetical protein